MRDYFHRTTAFAHTQEEGAAIDAAVKRIRSDFGWTGPVRIPGNDVRGWLHRPDDGHNSANDVQHDVARANAEIDRILGIVPASNGGAA